MKRLMTRGIHVALIGALCLGIFMGARSQALALSDASQYHLPANNSNPEETTTIYEDQVYGFTVSIPDTWYIQPAPEGYIGAITQITSFELSTDIGMPHEIDSGRIKLDFGVQVVDKPTEVSLADWVSPDPSAKNNLIWQGKTNISRYETVRQDYDNGGTGSVFFIQQGTKVYFIRIMPSIALENEQVHQILQSFTIIHPLTTPQQEVNNLYPTDDSNVDSITTPLATNAPPEYRLPFVGPAGISTGPGCYYTHLGASSEAIDFSMQPGKPLYSPRPGTVIYAQDAGADSFGNLVKIQHDDGSYTSWYAHLSAFNVAFGDKVGRGELVAWSGNTGYSRDCPKLCVNSCSRGQAHHSSNRPSNRIAS